jgi:hypothetical protein
MANNPEKKSTQSNPNTTKPQWKNFLEDNKWTTYLAYQLKQNSTTPVDTLLKYEALLTQCSYLSRMAYCPADIFCRMTQHLDVTPNAFNNYIRAIEKIYDRLFNYKCSFDSKYIQEHPEFSKYFNPFGDIPASQTNAGKVENAAPKTNSKQVGINVLQNNTVTVEAHTLQQKAEQLQMAGGSEFNNTKIKEGNKPLIGFFVQNKKKMNVYLYVHHNPSSRFNSEKTLFIAFKGSSSIKDFKHDLKSAAFPDQLLSELNNAQNTPKTTAQNNKKNKPGKAGYGFIKALKPSIQEICKKIEELQSYGFERIIITGHSLGGALASLFGYYLKKYKPTLIDKPIHVITFGACCVFDALGRNEFNAFLNILDGKPVFTLDRVTANLDPIIVLPADLDHPGYTILRNENFSYTKTGRTKEIGEIRDMLELKKKETIDLTADDLLSTENFVKLFTNFDALKKNGRYDENSYKEKFKINFGTKAEEQYPILEIAIPDAKLPEIQELFNKIEKMKTILGKIPKDKEPKQVGGLHNPFSKGSNATKAYKKETEIRMPNQIQYSCYAQMTLSFCHGAYMGVSYVMVLRLPNISEGKLRKEPTKNYTLYQIEKDGKKIVYSLSPNGKYSNNKDCSSEFKQNNSTKKNNGQTNLNNSSRKNNGQTKPKKSLMNQFTGFTTGLFKTKNNKKSTGYTQLKQTNTTTTNSGTVSEDGNSKEVKKKSGFNCSIL